MVGKAVYRAVRQGFLYRDAGRKPGVFVDNVKNLVHRVTNGFLHFPTGELFGKRIQERCTSFGISGDHCITDGIERHSEFFFADLQGRVGLLQLFIRRFLKLKQMLCFEKRCIFEPLLCSPIDQIGEGECKQECKQAGDNDEEKHAAHVRIEFCVILLPIFFLYLDETFHLGTNRIH